MTIQAQHPHHSIGRVSDRPTHGLDPSYAGVANPFALLDPRTRRHSISNELAPAGRYLSIEHEDETRLLPLERPITHIGRGLAADVRLEDPHVSRRHAIVAQRGDGVRVLDDRSSGGTFVNGRPVTMAYLSDGDVLRVGRVVFRYVEVAPQAQPSLIRRRIPLPVRAPGPRLGRAT